MNNQDKISRAERRIASYQEHYNQALIELQKAVDHVLSTRRDWNVAIQRLGYFRAKITKFEQPK